MLCLHFVRFKGREKSSKVDPQQYTAFRYLKCTGDYQGTGDSGPDLQPLTSSLKLFPGLHSSGGLGFDLSAAVLHRMSSQPAVDWQSFIKNGRPLGLHFLFRNETQSTYWRQSELQSEVLWQWSGLQYIPEPCHDNLQLLSDNSEFYQNQHIPARTCKPEVPQQPDGRQRWQHEVTLETLCGNHLHPFTRRLQDVGTILGDMIVASNPTEPTDDRRRRQFATGVTSILQNWIFKLKTDWTKQFSLWTCNLQ